MLPFPNFRLVKRMRAVLLAVGCMFLLLAPPANADHRPTFAEGSASEDCWMLVPAHFGCTIQSYASVELEGCDETHCTVHVRAVGTGTSTIPAYQWIANFVSLRSAGGGTSAGYCVGSDSLPEPLRSFGEEHSEGCPRVCDRSNLGHVVSCGGERSGQLEIPPGRCGGVFVESFYHWNYPAGAVWTEMYFFVCRNLQGEGTVYRTIGNEAGPEPPERETYPWPPVMDRERDGPA